MDGLNSVKWLLSVVLCWARLGNIGIPNMTRKARIDTFKTILLGLARVQVQLSSFINPLQQKFKAIAYQESILEIAGFINILTVHYLPRFPVLPCMPSDYPLHRPLKHSYGNELPSHNLFAFLQLFWVWWTGCQLISPRFVCLQIVQEYHTHTNRCFSTCTGRQANTSGQLPWLSKILHKRRTF